MFKTLETRDDYVFHFYNYTPSKAAAVIFLVLFGVVTAYQIFQTFKTMFSKDATKKEKHVLWIMLPFILGGLFETVGYVGRIISSSDTNELNPYIIQSVLLLVAPALYAATLYMSLGRLIARVECEKYSLIPLKYLTKIFVFGDVMSFLLQSSGGGLMASSKESRDTGERLIIGGLIVQIVFFGMFMVVEIIFHTRITRRPNEVATGTTHSPSKFNDWNTILLALFTCSILIFIRSVFRLIEYIQGNDGYLISHEVFLYCFDATLMFLNMVFFVSQDFGNYFVTFHSLRRRIFDKYSEYYGPSVIGDKEAAIGRNVL